MYRCIIAGGRDFNDYGLLRKSADAFLEKNAKGKEPIHIVSGLAKGADTLGTWYAAEKGFECDRYPAHWDLHGKRAGFIRNEEMARNADAVLAFWDGESHGTEHMIRIARERGLTVEVVRYGNGGTHG